MAIKRNGCEGCTDITCVSTQQVLSQDIAKNVRTAYDRVKARGMSACLFGSGGTCCRNCNMGPCQIIDGVEDMLGICGATADTVAARNFARVVAAGSAAHTDHAREMVKGFIDAAKGEGPHQIKDVPKLKRLAEVFGIVTEEREIKDIAIELGEKALAEFGKQDDAPLSMLKRATPKRQAIWKKLGIAPRGIDREVVEMMHRTHMGVDQDYQNIMLQASRCALSDGWGSSMLSTELTDIMFGTPVPRRAIVDLGVLKTDQVNICVHGHEPLLAEALCIAAQDPEMLELAKKQGAKGINLAGVCCTGNEILMRRGIPVAAGFIQQEIVLATGAVEAMVGDVQCLMPSIVDVANNFHTNIITTNYRAKMPGAIHIQFEEHEALNSAKQILTHAIKNFKKRGKCFIPQETKMDVVVGFSHETINTMLGGRFRASYRPLNDNIINGRIRGVAAIVGCDNFKMADDAHETIVRELLKNNILVLATGCAATSLGKAGLLNPEAARFCGDSLREVCETVGMPPVLHMGSCVDNSRILIAATEMVRQGGLGDDITDLPAIGTAPLWMSEKAVAIGQYFVASGAQVVFQDLPTTGAKNFNKYLLEGIMGTLGAHWNVAKEPLDIARIMIEKIEAKRDALGINKKKERVLFDMDMRRDLGGGPLKDVGCHGPSAS
ncbi:MAG: anaerobic carbon-monoxide dehydrogenase catalytic subunit [Proteobacteria bacterium]|jgi:carbon-monoxide dehydrogenase catalytic subunit|nr:anaerobic carbon-monoxide dehydrogenase catalytic subunit [Pseudomonadota bacterium]MCG2822349.1 anaerobic carbon-monoxide dehydrogenase catalytic subunit [Desulfobulbaceae bacterium]MDP2003580.1 anaerobic carbon-monoxide dehydrogenase catalytic subunit [Desulfurivibrionaceae bacterium]PKN16808.1 MAG: carbon-monoxide dehydrogenase catalytic subunit [Deltaproteobacteria bacterium HGW-Deltaproteobacteria-3]MBU4229364.1 anaerobic carbon-monoxide dehydrogenase catalytic subunit [Pseudomonadota b